MQCLLDVGIDNAEIKDRILRKNAENNAEALTRHGWKRYSGFGGEECVV